MNRSLATIVRYLFQNSRLFTHSLLLAGAIGIASFGTADAAPVTWHGASGNPTFWDIGVTPNWNGSGATFANGDAATFDGTAVGYTVNVQTAVSPVSMAISSSGGAYTFNGSAIAGATSIVKTGSATANFTQASLTFTGGTSINSASTINYQPTSGTSHSFGSGAITLNNSGAQFEYNPATAGSTLSNNFIITSSANGLLWRMPANALNTFGGTIQLDTNITLGNNVPSRNQLRESVVLTGDRTIAGSGFSPVPVISGQITSSGSKRNLTINNSGDNPGWFMSISSPVVGGWDIKDLIHDVGGNREATLRVDDDEREFFDNMEANGGYLKILTAGVQFARTPNAEIGFDIIIKPQTAGTGTEYGTGIRGNSAFTVVNGGGLHGTGIYRSGVPGCCQGGGQEFKTALDVTVTGTGMISPGDPTAVNTAGVLTINGNLTFSGGELRIDVLSGNGVAGTDFDRLVVQDSLVPSGRGSVSGISTANLIVDFHNVSFADLEGDVLTILTSSLTNFAGQQFGSVTTLNTSDYFVNVIYGAGFIQLALVSTIPEPSSLSLLGIGLVGAAIVRRRRQRAAV